MEVRAPWTEEQVKKLQEWQDCDWVHPFTCAHHGGCILAPAADGWTCPLETCDYRQDWCHDFMLLGAPPNPLEALAR